MMHVIVEEGLVDEAFIARPHHRLRGAARERRRVYSPEAMAPICGIDAETIREVARLYATSKGSMILWGMGISQHVHGTDNARCLIALALIDRPDRPARHRACIRCAARTTCRARPTPGLIPMMYPDYQRVDDAGGARSASRSSGAPTLDPKPGLTVVEIMNAVNDGEIRGMYIMGENPAMSDPDVEPRARGAGRARAPGRAGHLPHRDRVPRRRRAAGHAPGPRRPAPSPTPTAWCSSAARRIEPPGDAQPGPLDHPASSRSAWASTGTTAHPSRGVRRDAARAWTRIAGITWERLERESSVTYPCVKEGDPGEPVVFIDDFPTRTRPRAGSCRPTSSRPPSGPTPSTRWC